ncbi:MAG: S-layer homology domain-containing protein [Clostridia bacterium]|nr:S-layer homology domain-containing protein [Clostridia bacterium]
MLNLKKVIALVCVFAMVLTTVAFGATYTDVTEDSAYYEAVETLNKLGIVTGYEDGTYKPEDGVTRAEMAALIARIQGYGETAKAPANTAFTDVPSSHWASGYIANAAGMGIINGYGDGTFGPEDPVLYEQAVKMIMATLGYTPYAEHNGGYPTGYLAAAQRYDVSLNVANAAVGSEANRGTVAQLLAMAIDTPLMVQNRWSTDGTVDYVICDGQDKNNDYTYKTLMSENLGYVKLRGIITDNGLISTVATGSKTFDVTDDPAVAMYVKDSYSTNNKDFNGIKSNDSTTWATKKLLTGTTDAADYLGQSVIGYVKKLATDDYELVSVAVDTNRNDELVINLDSYAGITTGTVTPTGGSPYTVVTEVKYYKDGDNDVTKVDLQDVKVAVYNNEGTDAATAFGYLSTPSLYGGTITLIDNDDKNGYDVAILEVATTAVVKKVTEDGVAFKKGITLPNTEVMGMLEIDAEDENKVVAIYKDGELIDAADLQEWDVLSVIAVKENANVIVAEVVSNQVVGAIASRKNSKTSDTTYAYKVADNWYDVAKSAYEASASTLEVGIGGTFYIDKYGKIAAFDEDSSLAGGVAANYGYITAIEAKVADFSGDGYKVNVQIVTADGVEVLPLKNKAKINVALGTEANYPNLDDDTDDTLVVDASNWTSDLDADLNAGSYKLVDQVVKYTKNSAGELAEITMADHDNKDKFDAKASFAGTTIEYDAENTRFLGKGEVDADALVFIIGGFTGGAGYTSVTDSKLGTLADLDDKNKYTIKGAYTKDEDVNVIVIDADTVATSTTSSIAVLTEVGEGTNDDEEAIYILSYYLDGELSESVATIAKTDLSFSGTLTAGDIVKVKVGSDGAISDIKMVFDFATDVRTAYNGAAGTLRATNVNVALKDTSEVFAGGFVKDYSDTSSLAKISTVYGDTTQDEEYKLSRATNVYVIDGTGLNLSIKVGSDANFKYFDGLYAAGKTTADVYLDDTMVSGGDDVAIATVRNYTDHVYVRAYEGKVTDVVIVKAPKALKIKDIK